MKQHCIVNLHYKPRSGMCPTVWLLHTRCCVLGGMTKRTRSAGALQRSGLEDIHNVALTESGGAVKFVHLDHEICVVGILCVSPDTQICQLPGSVLHVSPFLRACLVDLRIALLPILLTAAHRA